MYPERPRPTIGLANVTARAPGRAVPLLDRVSMVVGAGERVIVLGPSGSGKSTLLQVLTGVVPFSQNLELEGEVYLEGEDVTELSVVERSRQVGVLAQDPSAAVCLAQVDQEVALPLESHGVAREQIAGRVGESLERADATSLRGRSTGELSGGELQRVALAASLAARPTVVLLDEPTSMLDPAGVRAVRRAIETMVAERDSAVVLVEHRLDEFAGIRGAGGLPERALVLGEGGHVLADGPTVRVLRENAVSLHHAGCWLPLEIELLAVTGYGDGIAAGPVRDWLRAAAVSTDLERASDSEPRLATEPTERAEQPSPLLRARSLLVGYPKLGGSGGHRRRTLQPILRGVDLTVSPGEVVALLGANGSGKSSLLLTLAGLLQAGEGTVSGPRPGMVFQNPEHQFVAHRVRDEIAEGLTGDPTDVTRIVDHQLRAHRLEHVADQDPHRLSGGEKRRLSLAAMLAHSDRPMLLADEPTFGLDRRDTIATAHVFRAAATRGRAVMFSSHDLRFVATVADRVIVLADGAVVADGPTGLVLQDESVLHRARVELPPLVAWLHAECGPTGAARALRYLDAAHARPTPAPHPEEPVQPPLDGATTARADAAL